VLELEGAGDSAPLDAQSLRLLVSLYARVGAGTRRVRALEQLASVSQDEDERVRTLVELSDLLFSGPEEARDLAAAERALTSLRELVPTHPEPFDRLARLYDSQERHAELDALLAEWLAGPELETRERTSLSLRLARLRVGRGRTAEGAEVLRAARARGAANAAIHELLLHCLCELGELEEQVALCAERSDAESDSARLVWLERWLGALEATGASAEQRLDVIDGLAGERELGPELLEVRLNLLREVDRPEALAESLEISIPLLDRADPRRRVRGRELLALYEGPLDDIERALSLTERELGHDATLLPHAVRLSERLGDPAREAALLQPLVERDAGAAPADWRRRLGLALARLERVDEAEPLLRAIVDEQPRDVEVIDALVTMVRRGRDPEQLGHLLELQFPLRTGGAQLAVVREGVEAAERARDPAAALRWLRRWHDLEPLPAELCRRWTELEARHGDSGQRLRALHALADRLESAEDRAPVLAEQGGLQLERGDLDAARDAYAGALQADVTPRVDWLEAQDGVLERLGRKSERLDVLAALARHPQRTPEERARTQQTYIELLVAQPGMRSEAARELRLFVDSDPVADRDVQVERMRSLLRVYEELERSAEWCALAEELIPIMSETERCELQRELAQCLGGALGTRERAILAWNGVLESDRDDVEALDALTELQRGVGRETLLVDALERRAALPAGDPGLRAGLLIEAAGVHWRELGDAARALDDAERALELQANLPHAHELRAELAGHLGQSHAEVESLRALVAPGAPGAPVARQAARWVRLGELEVELPERFDEAVRAAERALELTGTASTETAPTGTAAPAEVSRQLRSAARQVLERAGRFEAVAPLLRQEIDAADDAARTELLRRLAHLCFEHLGRAEETCERLDALAVLETPTAEDEELWAEAFAARGRWREALDHERRALEKLGERAGVERWLELSRRAVERLGDERAAREACDQALLCDPSSVAARSARLELCTSLGDDRGALDDATALGDSLPTGPASAGAFARAADIAHRRIGDLERARELYDRALEQHSNQIEALIGAGELDLERGEWLQAERRLARACELLADTPAAEQRAHAARLAARAALQQGRNAEAARLLETALSQEPDHPEALDQLAEVSLALAAHGTAGRALEARLALGDLEGSERSGIRRKPPGRWSRCSSSAPTTIGRVPSWFTSWRGRGISSARSRRSSCGSAARPPARDRSWPCRRRAWSRGWDAERLPAHASRRWPATGGSPTMAGPSWPAGCSTTGRPRPHSM
jgi:tetratricopeptide (TPR) repeat protein